MFKLIALNAKFQHTHIAAIIASKMTTNDKLHSREKSLHDNENWMSWVIMPMTEIIIKQSAFSNPGDRKEKSNDE